MKSHWALALAAVLTAAGCKTSGSQSALRADDNGAVADAPAAFAVGQLNDSFWRGEFDAQFSVIVTLRVEKGNGVLSVNADGETQTLDFEALRMATAAELAQYRTNLGATFLDSAGVEVRFSEAVVLTDENGALKQILPVLHAEELFIHPMGPLLKQSDAPESEVVKCGGMAGLGCPAGLHCKGALMDKMGICAKATPPSSPAGNAGGGGATPPPAVHKCGGFAGFKCPEELVCKNTVSLDGMGICVEPPNGAGKPKTGGGDDGKGKSGPAKCGTIAGLTCPKGQVCKKPTSQPFDGSGICVDKKTN